MIKNKTDFQRNRKNEKKNRHDITMLGVKRVWGKTSFNDIGHGNSEVFNWDCEPKFDGNSPEQ